MIDDWCLMIDDWCLMIDDWGLMIDDWCRPWTNDLPRKCLQKKSTWLKSFSVPSQRFRHILNRLPLLQGSLPKNKGSWGNNFLRRICWGGSKSHSSSKTSPFQKKNGPRRFLQKKIQRKNFGVEKRKIANHLKRILPKFRADRSHPRGVNGRTKKQTKFASTKNFRVAVVESGWGKKALTYLAIFFRDPSYVAGLT